MQFNRWVEKSTDKELSAVHDSYPHKGILNLNKKELFELVQIDKELLKRKEMDEQHNTNYPICGDCNGVRCPKGTLDNVPDGVDVHYCGCKESDEHTG